MPDVPITASFVEDALNASEVVALFSPPPLSWAPGSPPPGDKENAPLLGDGSGLGEDSGDGEGDGSDEGLADGFGEIDASGEGDGAGDDSGDTDGCGDDTGEDSGDGDADGVGDADASGVASGEGAGEAKTSFVFASFDTSRCDDASPVATTVSPSAKTKAEGARDPKITDKTRMGLRMYRENIYL